MILLIFETKHFESRSALFVNKHVFFQSNRFDSFINVFSFTNFSISNQSFSESLVVVELDITHDFVSVFVSTLASVFEIELNSAYLWLSRNVSLIDNHSIAVIILNTFDTSLSSSFSDSTSSFFSENLLFQITTIILQNFFKYARREARQQVKNVYSYDLVINQIIRSFYSEILSTNVTSHLLFYLFSTVSIQIFTSTIKGFKQRRNINRSKDRSREKDVEREISRWTLFNSLLRLISRR